MPQEQEPLKRITINIFESDYNWLQEALGEVSYQVWVRALIHDEIKAIKEGDRDAE